MQQAFAEANANLQQANTIIGEYSMVDGDEDDEPLPVLETVPQKPALNGVKSLSLPKWSLPGTDTGQPINGHNHQPSLLSGDQLKRNGTAAAASLNRKGESSDNGALSQQEELMPYGDDNNPPPVPRPRLLA